MGGRTSGSGMGSRTEQIRSQIEELRKELVKPFEPHGRKGWQQQLDADTKRKAAIERKINQLEKKLGKTEPPKPEPKPEKKPATEGFKWQRAGEGWYVGQNGFEIRESDSGGFDVVKVNGSNASTVKHFSSLKDARKYNPET